MKRVRPGRRATSRVGAHSRLSDSARAANGRLVAAMLDGRDPSDEGDSRRWVGAQLDEASPGLRFHPPALEMPGPLELLCVGQLLERFPPDVARGFRSDLPLYHLAEERNLPLLPQSIVAAWHRFPGLGFGLGLVVHEHLIDPIRWCTPRRLGSHAFAPVAEVRRRGLEEMAARLRGRSWTLARQGRRTSLRQVRRTVGPDAPPQAPDLTELADHLVRHLRLADLLEMLRLPTSTEVTLELPFGSRGIAAELATLLGDAAPVFLAANRTIVPMTHEVARRCAPAVVIQPGDREGRSGAGRPGSTLATVTLHGP